MRIYLVRIPRRKGHSIQSIVRRRLTIAGQAAASTVRFELAQTGGISSCLRATPIEQPPNWLVMFRIMFVLRLLLLEVTKE